MAKTAQDLKNLISDLKANDRKTAYQSLVTKCRAATAQMISDREETCLVDLDSSDIPALEEVTDTLRSLGYKFRYIERQNQQGEFITNKLLISIQHCK